MNNKLKYLICFVFYSSIVFGQQDLLIKQSKISEVMTFERSLNSDVKFYTGNIELSQDIYPLVDKYRIENPLIVQRNSSDYLPLTAEYFFTASDSLVRFISYIWEKNRFGDLSEKMKQDESESKNIIFYNKEFDRIQSVIESYYGKPDYDDKKPQEKSSSKGTYYLRRSKWDFDDKYGSLTMIFGEDTYRISFRIYWKG